MGWIYGVWVGAELGDFVRNIGAAAQHTRPIGHPNAADATSVITAEMNRRAPTRNNPGGWGSLRPNLLYEKTLRYTVER